MIDLKKALLVSLTIAALGCRGDIPDSVKGAADAAQLQQRVAAHCRANPEPGCQEQVNALWCVQQGGHWAHFSDSCQDLCGPQQITAAGGSVICTDETPPGCHCPGALCWDGIACSQMTPIESAFAHSGPLWPVGCAISASTSAKADPAARRALLADNAQCLQGWMGDAIRDIEGAAAANLGASITLGCLDKHRRLVRRLEEKFDEPAANDATEVARLEALERRVEEIGQGANACLSPTTAPSD